MDILNPEQPIAAYEKFRAQLGELKTYNAAVAFDYEDPKGNKEARSHVYKLRQTKGAVEAARKAEKAASLEYGRKVDADAKAIIGEIEEMIELHWKPIAAIEQREAARVAAIREQIEELIGCANPTAHEGRDSEQIRDRLAEIKATEIGPEFAEFAEEALRAKDRAIACTENALAAAVQREEDAAELERLRREQAKREQAEREQRIAEEAAARAKAEAEANAERERVEAERQAKVAQEAAERRELEAKLAAERAENARKEAEERAARAEEEGRIKAQKEAEAAKRQAEEEAARREANQKHVAKVNREARDAISKHADAEAVVRAIAKGEIPHVSIRY